MDANDWKCEMDRLMEMLQAESTLSLRKINRCFEASGRPFDDKFRQYFMKMSTLRLDISFNAVVLERGYENPLETTPNSKTSIDGNEIVNGANVPDVANNHADSLNTLQTGNSDDAPIEISDSDDDDDDSIGERQMQANEHAAEDGANLNSNKNPDGQNNGLDLNSENDDEIDVKRELKIENEIEMVDLPMIEFDPNKANDDSSTENDVDDAESLGNQKQSSSSSNASEQMKRNTLKRFKCEDCAFTAQYKSYLTRHRMIHGKNKPFKCEHCDFACRQKGHLQRHQRVHDGEKLMGAVRDPKDGTYKCPHCDRQFTKWNSLSSHVTLIHKNNRRLFNCSRCMRRFARKNKKDTHETRCRARRYECYLCKKYVTRKLFHMQGHMRTHTGERPFACAICNQYFRQKQTLERHLNSMHSHNKQ